MSETGLRERKRQRMYQAVSEVAVRLFLERGFDAVSVAEVAAAAEISAALGGARQHLPALAGTRLPAAPGSSWSNAGTGRARPPGPAGSNGRGP